MLEYYKTYYFNVRQKWNCAIQLNENYKFNYVHVFRFIKNEYIAPH